MKEQLGLRINEKKTKYLNTRESKKSTEVFSN